MLRSISCVSLLLACLGACSLELAGSGPAQSLDPIPTPGVDADGDPTQLGGAAGRPQEAEGSRPEAGVGGVPVGGGAPLQTDAGAGALGPASSADADAGAAELPDAGATPLMLSSAAFDAGQRLPDEHSCLGAADSPPLAWSAGPAGTESYAVALIVHTDSLVSVSSAASWVIWDIKAQGLPQGVVAGAQPSSVPGARQASRVTDPRGLFEAPHYQAPCAILGGQEFELVLYALSVATLPVGAQATPDQVMEEIESGGSLLAKSSLSFTFP